MTRFKAAAVGALVVGLAAAPVSSALANGNGRHYYGNPFYPAFGLAAAVVGAAAAIVTLPLVILDAAARAPGYYPQAIGYGAVPLEQDYYAPAQGYVSPTYAATPAYYPNPAVSYYSPPPAASYYYAPRAPYYPPRAVYYGYAGHRGRNTYAPNVGYFPPNPGRYPPAPTAMGPRGIRYAGGSGIGAPPQAMYGPGNNRYPSNSGDYVPRPAAYGPPGGNYNSPYSRPNDYRSR